MERNTTPLMGENELIIWDIKYDSAGYYYCYGQDYYTKKDFIAKSFVEILGTL